MHDILLSESERMWQSTLKRFVENEIGREYVRQCDMDRAYPFEAYDKVSRQGWLSLGTGVGTDSPYEDIIHYVIYLQALARYSCDFATAFAIPSFAASIINYHGNEHQRTTFLEPFLAGTHRLSSCITEPDAGSDVAAVKLAARRDGDWYVLDGQKMFASAAHIPGNTIAVLARTAGEYGHDGLSLILVPNDLEGITMTRLPTIARRATGTNAVFFDSVRVPAANLIGTEGEGWALLVSHLHVERVAVSAIYAANAQQAVTDAVQYAKQRRQFGRPIGEFQVIKHTLAQMQTEVDAAQLMVLYAARSLQTGSDVLSAVSKAKLYTSETLYRVAGEGMQILGGYGQLPESDMERYWREGRQATVGGGTSQMQRSAIAKSMGL